MSAAADSGSGRPQLTIAKDTTLRFSVGALLAVLGAAAGGAFWFSGEFSRMDRRLDAQSSDLKTVLETFRGYSRRADEIFDRVHEFAVIKERLQRSEHSGEAQDRRMAAHEAQINEIAREATRNSLAIELLMRAGPGDPSKKRNFVPFKREDSPFGRGIPARADKHP